MEAKTALIELPALNVSIHFKYSCMCFSFSWPGSVAKMDTCLTGDQEVSSSIPVGSGNFLL